MQYFMIKVTHFWKSVVWSKITLLTSGSGSKLTAWFTAANLVKLDHTYWRMMPHLSFCPKATSEHRRGVLVFTPLSKELQVASRWRFRPKLELSECVTEPDWAASIRDRWRDRRGRREMSEQEVCESNFYMAVVLQLYKKFLHSFAFKGCFAISL